MAKLQASFVSFNIEKKVTITNLGADTYQVYPKIWFSGETTLNKNQLKAKADQMLADLKTILNDELALQGATNVKYHIHRSTGSTNEV